VHSISVVGWWVSGPGDVVARMAVSALPLPLPREIVAEAAALLGALTASLDSDIADDELVAVVEGCQLVRSALRALEATVVAEVDDRDVARQLLGWGSTADWLTHAAGIRHGQGKQLVEHAHELVSERPATLAALAEGRISPEQADVVLDAVDRLPGDPETRDHGEQVLLDQAARLTATELQRGARHVVEVIDPDGSARQREAELAREDRVAHRRRFLTITDDGAGGIRLKGRGSVEDGATLRAALLPLTAPVPMTDPETCEQVPDPRDYGVRMWDAVVELAQTSLDANLPPDSHGARPRVVVTTDLEALRGALVERGRTDDGLELSPSAVRRLACDADIIPVALGGAGVVLDVGRSYRLVTAPIWTALVVRDRHCAFPGCRRPPIMCHAHHIVPWAQGGATKLANLVLLCGHHHRAVHETPWQVRLDSESGLPEFCPPGARTEQEWLRERPRRE
jgi:hypothetical protein